MDRQRLNQIGKSVFGLFDFEGANEFASCALRVNYAELIVVVGGVVGTQIIIYIVGLHDNCFVYISRFIAAVMTESSVINLMICLKSYQETYSASDGFFAGFDRSKDS